MMKLADYGHRAPRRENLRNVPWRTDEMPDAAAEEPMVSDLLGTLDDEARKECLAGIFAWHDDQEYPIGD